MSASSDKLQCQKIQMFRWAIPSESYLPMCPNSGIGNNARVVNEARAREDAVCFLQVE